MSKKSASQTVTRTEMTKAQWTWFQMKTHKVAYLMIAPFMIIFFLFTVIPVVASLLLSFTSFNMLQMPKFLFFDTAGQSAGTIVAPFAVGVAQFHIAHLVMAVSRVLRPGAGLLAGIAAVQVLLAL